MPWQHTWSSSFFFRLARKAAFTSEGERSKNQRGSGCSDASAGKNTCSHVDGDLDSCLADNIL